MAILNRTSPCEILDWDTTFFGFRVARVRGNTLTQERVRQMDAWCIRNGVRCLYFLARTDDADTAWLAGDNQFRLVDVRMTFEHRLPATVESARGDTVVRQTSVEDVACLQTIARQSYHDTRFYFDPNFARHLCDSFYETWIKSSCKGYADRVLVAELDGAPAGYITCHLDKQPHTGEIGLVGVSDQARGRGIGRTLVISALEYLSTQGMQKVRVVTQGRNYAAQRLYQRCGFLTTTVQLWYHKWYVHSETI